MKTVFFYGLFMEPDMLREKGLSPHNVDKAYVDGFELKIGQRATLVADNQSCAFGTIMLLQESELRELYSGEVVEDYLPQVVHVKTMDGEPVEAIAYLLPEHQLSGSNSDYASKLADVAKKLGLPDTYIDEIKSWI